MNIVKFALASAVIFTASSAVAQDAANGQKIFARCATCHGIGDANRAVGPNLNGVIGRTAGTQADFAARYSPAMKAAGEGGLVWNEDTINQYLADPRSFVAGNRMAFAGLPSERDRADVIAYIKTYSE